MKTENDKPVDYILIPMNEITSEARRISVMWMEGWEDWMKTDIRHKHKLASDIMNYAKSYHENEVKNIIPTDQQLQDMAMEKFPVEKVYTKDIFNDPIEYDDNKDNRELCLQALHDLVKVMGGENV